MRLAPPIVTGIAATVLAILLAFPAYAAPPVPTPTPYPVDQVAYMLTTVGGEAETLHFPDVAQDGITLSGMTAASLYPRGMVFTLKAESDTGTIEDVLLFIELVNGSRERVVARWDAASEHWIAHPWESGASQPAWTPFEFSWRVRDSAGVSLETEPISVVYADPTRAWHRVESDAIIAYWFGADAIDPDTIAARIVEAMAATEPRRVAGFGGPLSYKPLAVLYPTRETLNEIAGSGITNPTAGGWTSRDLGMTILHFSPRDETFTRNEDCIWLASRDDPRTVEDRLNSAIYGGIPHEVTHLYQFEYGILGPNWWTEGQAEYFTYGSPNYWPVEERLRHLATLQNIPPLSQDSISRELIQADGCQYLNYDVGQSFITWLLHDYGLETHALIVARHGGGAALADAIAEATGTSFLDLENEWRAYVGFPPVNPVDLDPSLALQPYEDPQYGVGDFVALPGTPAVSLLYRDPKPNALVSGSCWANTQVTILTMGQLDEVIYFQVDCMAQVGWMTRDQVIGPE